ncbi:hypothetical protein KSP35_02840 [Aquihabitans sp. G128]|uniref:hypothetical protein n=1 Tax=Aquihabitans sp. G128 TaxID=2849779 RepID=UPI001C21BD53|nr:hypothetical protein [Aquihabitans sp. G128]QXC61792.1 hypothetical protein KSP35_02840 [Aquihabitans sp. G128]
MTRAGGDLALLRALVEAALVSGDLRSAGGVWRLVGDVPLGPAFVELVGHRLRGIGPEARAALRAARDRRAPAGGAGGGARRTGGRRAAGD